MVSRTWNDDVAVVDLDLSDLASVRAAADEVRTRWGPPRRAGEQRRGDLVGTAGHRPGLRVHLRGEPPGSFLPDLLAAGPAPGVVPGADRQRDVGRPSLRVEGHALRRPPERAALRGDGRLLPGQAGERPVHRGAGPTPGRDRRDGQRRAPGLGAQPIRHGRRPLRRHRRGDTPHAALPDQPRPRGPYVDLLGDVAPGAGSDGRVLGARASPATWRRPAGTGLRQPVCGTRASTWWPGPGSRSPRPEAPDRRPRALRRPGPPPRG